MCRRCVKEAGLTCLTFNSTVKALRLMRQSNPAGVDLDKVRAPHLKFSNFEVGRWRDERDIYQKATWRVFGFELVGALKYHTGHLGRHKITEC